MPSDLTMNLFNQSVKQTLFKELFLYKQFVLSLTYHLAPFFTHIEKHNLFPQPLNLIPAEKAGN